MSVATRIELSDAEAAPLEYAPRGCPERGAWSPDDSEVGPHQATKRVADYGER